MNMTVPRLPRDRLRTIVFDIVEGRALTSDQVPSQLLGMVFLPVMFGAMTPPESVLPPRPAEPVDEPMPTAPPALVFPDDPVEPTPPEPPPYPTELMELVRWGRLLEVEIIPYQDAIARYEASIDDWRRTALTAHEVALSEHRERCRVLKDEHDARIAEYNAACDAVMVRNSTARSDYDEAKSRWNDEAKEVYRRWTADVGVILGEYANTFPTGVNGFPMFHAVTILHREDWDIVRTAVSREIERRKSVDILGAPNDPIP